MLMKYLLILAKVGLMYGIAVTGHAGLSCSDWPNKDFFETTSLEDVRDCLADGASVGSRDENGRTPLHWAAAASRDVAVMVELLTAGANPELVDTTGQRAIHVAAAVGRNPIMLSYLVAWGSDAEAEVAGKAGRCPWSTRRCAVVPLHLAAARPDGADFVASLLATGANANARDDQGRTPLHHAAAGAAGGMSIKLLLNAGASVDIADQERLAPLHIAARRDEGALEMVSALLAAGASADQREQNGTTPLMWAARLSRNSEALKVLIEASDTPCVEDDRERTVLQLWDRNEHLERDDVYWALHDRCMN